MPAQLLDGRDLSARILHQDLIPRVQKLKSRQITPKLIVILVGDNPSSVSYIKQKTTFAAIVGMEAVVQNFAIKTTEKKLLQAIIKLNQDSSVHGIIVQLPLPSHISNSKVLATIAPQKDVDGFTSTNIGQLFLDQKTLACCTPQGIMSLLQGYDIDLAGKRVVVVGRSNIVGKPVAILALQQNATVTICHSRTKELASEVARADILIAAIGQPQFISGDWLKPGAVVVDVGIHRQDDGKLVGDVDFESARQVASWISPVPGGVGPMTVISLLANTILAAEHSIAK